MLPIPPLVMGDCHFLAAPTLIDRSMTNYRAAVSEKVENYFKMAAKEKEKRTCVTMVRDQYLSFATSLNPLVSHWSLPLISWQICQLASWKMCQLTLANASTNLKESVIK
jgi:hypothetical protein